MGSLLDWLHVLTLIVVAAAAVSLIVYGYFRASGQSSLQWMDRLGADTHNDGNGDGRAEFLSALRNASHEIVSDLDSRVASTRQLLKEADERIATLAELLARFEQVATSRQEVVGRSILEASTDKPTSHPTDIRRSVEKGTESAESHNRTLGERPVHAKVRALAREGRRPEEIAKELGMGTGEVLLILGLSRKA